MKKKIYMCGKLWVIYIVYSYDKCIIKVLIYLKIYGEILIGIKIIVSINLIF